jgi:hypothetical protein
MAGLSVAHGRNFETGEQPHVHPDHGPPTTTLYGLPVKLDPHINTGAMSPLERFGSMFWSAVTSLGPVVEGENGPS